jgi:hypothetical protein
MVMKVCGDMALLLAEIHTGFKSVSEFQSDIPGLGTIFVDITARTIGRQRADEF